MIKTNGFTIQKNSEFGYTWIINGDYKSEIYLSVRNTKILEHSFYDDETNTLIFTAEKVELLSNYLDLKHDRKMDYITTIKLIQYLTKQINYLNSHNFGFYGFDLDDILVINNNIFFVATSKYILPMLDTNSLIFYYPIKFPYFSNPELFNLTSLPGEINYKCSYYSLGALIVYCLLNNYLLVGNEIKSIEEIEYSLTPIKNTKMYWFLKRCLSPITSKRLLLFF